MQPDNFKEIWEDAKDEVLTPLPIDSLLRFNFQPTTLEFLLKAGLPDGAAPWLSFVQDREDGYNCIAKLNEVYKFLGSDFDHFILIGSDGEGNPIVINTSTNDVIEWLNHEDFSLSVFMNTSLCELADFLVYYRDFIRTVMAENGPEAALNSEFTDGQFERLKLMMDKSDIRAIDVDSFWYFQLEGLLEDREYCKNE